MNTLELLVVAVTAVLSIAILLFTVWTYILITRHNKELDGKNNLRKQL
jgi:hypothetical protein